ncbi:DUF305 domain-containing protein [Sphaerisporangium corydalis]|uniref:DUF305 domain-containing protein n=1 Tax=Sphaerisporangium corydalis TaxID=1441875 RepID=A0ABV9EF36_9ACTN|nr:DUF305 domain-containing protein [Sphaerisporangium corydalis]
MGRAFSVTAMGLLVALGLSAVTGCASAPGRGAVSVAATSAVPYNLTDVLFSREMILHYRQSIVMAGLVKGRSDDPYVKGLADAIVKEEPPLIDAMVRSLKTWEFTVPDADNPPEHQMPGMLSPAQLLLLKGKSGEDFDKLWLTTLARHVNYGVLLAEKARDQGKDRATVELARGIAATEKPRIAQIVQHLS